MHKLEQIKKYVTSYEKVHESIYRSYSILKLVKEMLERWDSKETILMIINFLEE